MRCAGISDKGILEISDGCNVLQMINISYCNDITYISLISLSKCTKINTFESRGCPFITSFGLAAMAVGCKQLIKLDLKKCYLIDDLEMVPLAHFSQNLRQITHIALLLGLVTLANFSCLQGSWALLLMLGSCNNTLLQEFNIIFQLLYFCDSVNPMLVLFQNKFSDLHIYDIQL